MKYINVAFFVLIVLLVLPACSNKQDGEPMGHLTEVKVVEKKSTCCKITTFKIIVEKNGQRATFETNYDLYNMINEGVIINADYNREGKLINVTFPNLN